MPPKKKGKGKGGKDKKGKGKMKKFNLDLFGILTFTRFEGEPFTDFMYTPDKKNKGKEVKGKKKKKKPVVVPRLPKFPPVPEDPAKDMKMIRMRKKVKDPPDVIIPTTSIGFKEKTTRPPKPFQEGGSISDVMCGKKYPLPPRPQPHGGVYGDPKCLTCKSTGGILQTAFGTLNKKLRKLLTTEFDKAQFILEWFLERLTDAMKMYEKHMSGIMDEMGPVLDGLDESEWDDHFEVRGLVDKWRDLQKDLDMLRAELKQFIKNREEEIAKAVAAKLKEMEDTERQMLALEKKIQEAMESLKDWQENSGVKIEGPEKAIAAVLEMLRKIRESIMLERDTLRNILGWELQLATANTVSIMEGVIRADLDVILGWMNPSWFKLFLENRKMSEERNRLSLENHLLELEVQTLSGQVKQMEAYEKEVESTRTHFITPPTLNDRVDKFIRYYDDFAVVQMTDYPTTRLIHE